MTGWIDVTVIGGGQAGLTTSHELTRAGVEHVVLERSRIAHTWRGRWESFCLVTPNWTVQLPGHPYDGDDPDGFMSRDEIVAYLERYAASFVAPVREGIDVRSVEPVFEGGFDVRTSAGDISTGSVVVATGTYQRPHRPAGWTTLPHELVQVDVGDYREPGALPEGRVLVIGSGQSGCQLAEELLQAGRDVFLACGRAPWAPRRLDGRDLFWWVIQSGFMDQPFSALPTPLARLGVNPQASGRDGGHDLHYRTLRRDGVTLLGHFLGAEGRQASFAPDLADTVAWGDERHRELMGLVRKVATERSLPMPDIPQPQPFDGRAPETLDLAGFGAVVFAGGFRPDYASWVRVPGAFDDMGFPVHSEGASTVAPGLYFVGARFQRTRKSSILYGVGEDAAVVARQVAARHGASLDA